MKFISDVLASSLTYRNPCRGGNVQLIIYKNQVIGNKNKSKGGWPKKAFDTCHSLLSRTFGPLEVCANDKIASLLPKNLQEVIYL